MEYKGYKIRPITNLIGYEIKYDGKGSVHSSLLGTFTSSKIATEAIDSYLTEKKRKEDKDGETVPSGRDKPIHGRSYNRRKSVNDS